jgi:hypothetical protein
VLQNQFTLTPLSVYNGGAAQAPAGTPTPDPRVGKDLQWWEKFRIALQAFPPPPADAPFIKLCEQFGLTQADSPYVDMDPERAAALIEGAKAGQAKIDELMKRFHATPEGWQSALHVFDYNLDYFEIGTIDAPSGRSPTASRPTSRVPSPPAAACGATTATRLTTRSSGSTPTATHSTGRNATSCT